MKITSIEAVKIDYPPVNNPTRPRLREVSDLKPTRLQWASTLPFDSHAKHGSHREAGTSAVW